MVGILADSQKYDYMGVLICLRNTMTSLQTYLSVLLPFLLFPTSNASYDFTKSIHNHKNAGIGCNMNGQVLNAITVEEKPFVIYNSGCINASPTNNNSYIDVSNCIYGWVVDVVMALEKNCNFTLKSFTMENLTYGDVIEAEDGTFLKSGLFAQIEKFDMILGAPYITIPRMKELNYITDLGFDRMAIFIKNDIGEQNDWWMYGKIFSIEVWLVLFGIALFPSLLISTKDFLLHDEKLGSVGEIVSKFMSSFALNFGGNFFHSRNRALVLIAHLSYGIIIWIFFRGSLTSKLTSRSYNYPFTTLEELSGTHYSLLTMNKDSKAANDFLNAPQHSVYHKILKNNMDDGSSFVGVEDAFQKMFEKPLVATYFYEQVGSHSLAKRRLFCETLIPWRSLIHFPYSVAFNKDFKFFESINLAVHKLKESGLVKRYIAKYDKVVPQKCVKNEEVTIGYEKTFPLFIFLFSAMCVSVLYMFIVEILFKKK